MPWEDVWKDGELVVATYQRLWAKGDRETILNAELSEYCRALPQGPRKSREVAQAIGRRYLETFYWRDPPTYDRIGPHPDDTSLTKEEKELKQKTIRYIVDKVCRCYRCLEAF